MLPAEEVLFDNGVLSKTYLFLKETQDELNKYTFCKRSQP